MRRLDRTLRLSCTPDVFWQHFFDDDAFIERLYREGLGFTSLQVLKRTETERTMRLVPNVKLPDALGALLKGALSYDDLATLDRKRGELSFKSEALGGKLLTKGLIRIEADGEGKLVRRDSVTLEGKVFGLGGVLEATAEKELRSSWEREAEFLKKNLPTA